MIDIRQPAVPQAWSIGEVGKLIGNQYLSREINRIW